MSPELVVIADQVGHTGTSPNLFLYLGIAAAALGLILVLALLIIIIRKRDARRQTVAA